MGYTHYWIFNTESQHDIEKTEKRYQLALRRCTEFLKWYDSAVGSLSGYSAKSKKKYGGLQVNGAYDERCEDFCLRKSFYLNSEGFCKTNRLPYDSAVVGCLMILKHYLKDAITIESDGDDWELLDGYYFAQLQSGLKTLKPLKQG
jgi:hypothetical protein